jgi:hypothetical protein
MVEDQKSQYGGVSEDGVMKKIVIIALVCSVFSIASAMAAECDCIVDQVANMGNRIHVHCQTSDESGAGIKPPKFSFFALPLNSPLVDSFTIMAQAVVMQNLRDKRIGDLNGFCAKLSTGGYVGCLGDTNGHIDLSGRPFTLHVWYDEKDTSGTSFGCLSSDCRKPQAFAIWS